MRTLWKTFLAVSVLAAPVLAGALRVEIANPTGNSEAMAKNAILLAQTTACHSPEKSSLTATAEGLVDGKRQSIPLKLVSLSAPGTFAVTREWPANGAWVVKIVATNPEYKNHATAAIARVAGDSVEWKSVQHYFHEPTAEEVRVTLEGRSLAASNF